MLKIKLIILNSLFKLIASQEDKDKLNQVIEDFNRNPKFEYTYADRSKNTITTITRFDNKVEIQFKDLTKRTSIVKEVTYKKGLKAIRSLFMMIYIMKMIEEDNKKYFRR